MKIPESVRSEPVMEFVFQTIKLKQVASLLTPGYRSKYETIRNQIIEKIKTLPDDETFMFQPQDRQIQLDDDITARIIHGINAGLLREGLNWRISFSSKAQAFLVVPSTRHRPGKSKYKTKPPVAQMQMANGDKPTITDSDAARLTNLLELTYQHFGTTVKDLQRKLKAYSNPELANIRKAFLYVGRYALGMKMVHMGRLLKMSSPMTSNLCQQAMKNPQAKKYVGTLQAALSKNGAGN